jgi:hypothetical protein
VDDAVDLERVRPTRGKLDQVFGQMAAGKAGNTGEQDTHAMDLSLVNPWTQR